MEGREREREREIRPTVENMPTKKGDIRQNLTTPNEVHELYS